MHKALGVSFLAVFLLLGLLGGMRLVSPEGKAKEFSKTLSYAPDPKQVPSGYAWPKKDTYCKGPGEYGFRVLYSDPSSDSSISKDRIRELIQRANGFLNRQVKRMGGGASLQTVCTQNKSVVINNLKTNPDDGYEKIIDHLERAKLRHPYEKVLIFIDEEKDRCGIASNWDDDRLANTNVNNFYDSETEAILWRGCFTPFMVLHEYFHALGIVQRSAPNDNKYYHCTDGKDLMCADEEGNYINERNKCKELVIDCGADDYFSLAPKAGSYLERHWNLGWQGNNWIHLINGAGGGVYQEVEDGRPDTLNHTLCVLRRICI